MFYKSYMFQIAKFVGPTWGHLGPVGPRPHVGPMNLAIWGILEDLDYELINF